MRSSKRVETSQDVGRRASRESVQLSRVQAYLKDLRTGKKEGRAEEMVMRTVEMADDYLLVFSTSTAYSCDKLALLRWAD